METTIDFRTLLEMIKGSLSKEFEDDHRGDETITIIKNSPGIDGVMAIDSIVKERDPADGSFRMVHYKVPVLDDLGNPMHGAEDLGGECVCGNIVAKGSLFECMECNRLVCNNHVRFRNSNKEEPLCYVEGKGCFKRYKKTYERERELERKIRIIEKEALLAESTERLYALLSSAEQAKIDYKSFRPGLFGRLLNFSSSGHPISCPNCDFSPGYHNVTCRDCGSIFELRSESPRLCPQCGTSIREISCYRCKNNIQV
jgi:hypothetical protein